MHQSKRRKIDSGEHRAQLSRPFRSPLKSLSRGAESANEQADAPQQHDSTDADVDNPVSAQGEYIQLTQQLRKLQQSLDTAKQALNILTATQEADIETDTARWRRIAQAAADELFEGAQHRIKDMGGFATWQKNARVAQQDFFADDPNHPIHISPHTSPHDHVCPYATKVIFPHSINVNLAITDHGRYVGRDGHRSKLAPVRPRQPDLAYRLARLTQSHELSSNRHRMSGSSPSS